MGCGGWRVPPAARGRGRGAKPRPGPRTGPRLPSLLAAAGRPPNSPCGLRQGGAEPGRRPGNPPPLRGSARLLIAPPPRPAPRGAASLALADGSLRAVSERMLGTIRAHRGRSLGSCSATAASALACARDAARRAPRPGGAPGRRRASQRRGPGRPLVRARSASWGRRVLAARSAGHPRLRRGPAPKPRRGGGLAGSVRQGLSSHRPAAPPPSSPAAQLHRWMICLIRMPSSPAGQAPRRCATDPLLSPDRPRGPAGASRPRSRPRLRPSGPRAGGPCWGSAGRRTRRSRPAA